MLGFLQSFAYGLFLSCLPWLVTGLIKPELALPNEAPRRWQAFVRYGLGVPFLAIVLWLTSVWGGFSPTLEGWLAGLAAVAIELPIERRWRRWQSAWSLRRREAARDAEAARQRVELERAEREAGIAVLDPARPPVGADEVVLALCEVKQRLLDRRRPDLGTQADRLYSRYTHVIEQLDKTFDPRELTLERTRGMVAEVCRGAIDNLNAMASLTGGVAGIDTEYVRRRLKRQRLAQEEREALTQRLALVQATEHSLEELSGRNEAALTALDQAAVAVARVDTDRPQASLTADLAMAELRRFVDKAEQYGRRRDRT